MFARILSVLALLTSTLACQGIIHYSGAGGSTIEPNVIALEIEALDVFIGETLPVDFEEDIIFFPAGFTTGAGAEPAWMANDGSGNSKLFTFGQSIGASEIYGQTNNGINGVAADAGPVYVGFAIQRDTNNPGTMVNYGWARMSATSTKSITLYEFAYEDQLNTPINAGAIPEPGSAALVGAVLAGVMVLRRRYKS